MLLTVLGALGAAPAAAHPHEGADWDSIAATARALGSLPDAPGRDPGLPDGRRAARWAALGTLLPMAGGLAVRGPAGATLAAGGLFIGPSMGYFVGDCPHRGVAGVVTRVGLVTVGTILVGAAWSHWDDGNDSAGNAAGVLAAACLLGVGVSAVYDVVRTRGTVERRATELSRYRLEGMRAPGTGAPALAIRTRF